MCYVFEARPSIFVDRSAWKITNWVDDVEYLAQVKFSYIPFSGLREVTKR